MAYKQPYKQVNKDNDGASVVPFLAAIPALVAKIGTALKIGGTAAKGVATGVKATKAVTTGVKATKGATSAGKAFTSGGKVITKGAKITQSAQPTLRASNITSSVAKSSTKKGLGKAVAKAGEVGKDLAAKGKEVVGKAKEGVDKFKQGYDKAAGKIADKTGFEKDFIKEKGAGLASSAASSVGDKISSGGSGVKSSASKPVNLSPAERDNPSGITPRKSGFDLEKMDGINTADGVEEFNQGGPSMFDYRKNHGPSIKSKYNNVNYGASGPHDGIAPSLDEDNTEKNSFGDTSIGNFSAPITIKGVTFDAGDVMRLGIMGYKAGKKGLEKHRLKERGGKKFKGERKLQKENKKAAMNYDANKMKKHIKSLNDEAAESRYRKSLPKGTVANASVPNRDNKIKNKKINGKTYKVADSIDGLGMPEIPSLLKKRTT